MQNQEQEKLNDKTENRHHFWERLLSKLVPHKHLNLYTFHKVY